MFSNEFRARLSWMSSSVPPSIRFSKASIVSMFISGPMLGGPITSDGAKRVVIDPLTSTTMVVRNFENLVTCCCVRAIARAPLVVVGEKLLISGPGPLNTGGEVGGGDEGTCPDTKSGGKFYLGGMVETAVDDYNKQALHKYIPYVNVRPSNPPVDSMGPFNQRNCS